jgi:hypothetical protein
MNRDNKAMRMWEYAFAWGRNGTVYKDINGNLVTQNVREYLSQVGRDGWELCGTLPERDGHLLIFKRPSFE